MSHNLSRKEKKNQVNPAYYTRSAIEDYRSRLSFCSNYAIVPCVYMYDELSQCVMQSRSGNFSSGCLKQLIHSA